ncbi:MAG: shikimate dehydrogenase [Bacteroidetes bacterium]|nr:shikimate dehydrogenase [Bacteroidota bacterium]
MRLFGLIGYPLGHSFSAPYFAKKFSEEQIDARYENFPMEKIAAFEELVKGEPGLVGLNVTVPYKQKIIPYLDALDRTARSIGAVNTIFFCREEDRLSLLGYNTDVAGFERSLKEHLGTNHQQALVLGTGGSSKAVEFVLKGLEIEYQMVSRSRGEGLLAYDQLDRSIVESHTLIINTTPLGMHPHVDSYPAIPYKAITSGHLLFDLVYNPEHTRFLALGEEQGASIVNGSDMLVYQAEASWEIWNRNR